MSDIRLDEGTINIDGEWLSVEDLTLRIQEKMKSGDMKLTALAAALEELKTALENSHPLEVKLVLTKDEYEQLKSLGGEDDRESIRKAIFAFISGAAQVEPGEPSEPEDVQRPASEAKKALVVNCPHPQCMSPVEITSDERPLVVECPNCGTSGKLTEDNQWAKL